LSRIVAHVEQSPCYNTMQSAYRRGYSTETALLKLANYIYCGADQGRRALLTQFDPSTAFDMIDTNILLRRLQQLFGFIVVTLSWVRSFTTGRMHFVLFEDCCSTTTLNMFGECRKDRSEDRCFSRCTSRPSLTSTRLYDFIHTQYADDTQLCTLGCVEPVQ
jgi:hypothetical protein